MHPLTAQALWIGPTLSLVERLSIASFLANGYSYHLYVYDDDLNAPKGTTLMDANQIIPAAQIVRNTIGAKTYTHFANAFRYKLLHEKGGLWVDTDMICLKPLSVDAPYAFGLQEKGVINNAVLFAREPGSQLMDECYRASQSHVQQTNWGQTGPFLLTKIIRKLDLEHYAKPPECYYPVAWDAYGRFFKGHALPAAAEAVHLWNEMLRRAKIDANWLFPDWTLLGSLQKKFLPEYDGAGALGFFGKLKNQAFARYAVRAAAP